MGQEKPKSPKVFISYSWTSREHSDWVRRLVDRLRNNGADVILDVYRLREGHDLNAFMEQIATDPDMSKVLVISDKRYAEKADAREGGVGKETFIISSEVYEDVGQWKFIPVVTEFDESGKPYLPTFMKSRVYIDLSSEEKLEENYNQLLRAIFDKPLLVEPPLGEPPEFLKEELNLFTSTGSKLQSLKSAVLNDKPTARGLMIEYLRSYTEAAKGFRFNIQEHSNISSEEVKISIHKFLPYRDEFIDFISFISLYIDDAEAYKRIFQFFQSLLPYKDPPPLTAGFDHIGDNFRFILYEMFLYMIAALIKNEKFEMADMFMRQDYFVGSRRGNDPYHKTHVQFTEFNMDSELIDFDRSGRETRETGRLLRERASHPELSFDHLMEADFVLYLRSILHRGEYEWFWYPKTLNRDPYQIVFPIFDQASSKSGFNNLKVLLGINSKQELAEKLDAAIGSDAFSASRLRSQVVKRLMNLDKLDSHA
jgi:hypothetical protein